MVLISTFTFIVSTIDELQHNEAGEVEFPLLLQVTELSTKFREILQLFRWALVAAFSKICVKHLLNFVSYLHRSRCRIVVGVLGADLAPSMMTAWYSWLGLLSSTRGRTIT